MDGLEPYVCDKEMLQFGHGCGAVEITRDQPHGPRCPVSLQFGHGCGAVEMRNQGVMSFLSRLASIRPRLRSRGDADSP